MEHDSLDALCRRLRRLERENRGWRSAGAALVLAGLVIPAASLAHRRAEARQEPPAAARANVPESIVRNRLELARKALAIIRRKTALGPQVSHPVQDTYRWSVLQLGTQIYLSMGNDEPKVEDPEVYLAITTARPSRNRLAAFQAHYDLMKYWEDRLRPLADSTIMAPLDFLDVQQHRLQAELWLAREKERHGDEKRAKD
jgi:hypothetical protein